MRTKDLKSSKAITLIALVVTIIVLLILAGISIAALTGDNGILTNAQQTSTQSAYKGAEEQVKIAYMAVKTEIMAKTVEDGKYNPTTDENINKLANIVRKDLGLAKNSKDSNGTWKVEEDITAKAIKITYTDSKIDQGVIGTTNLTKPNGELEIVAIPREEGQVQYQIKLLDNQDAKLFVDTMNRQEGTTTTYTIGQIVTIASDEFYVIGEDDTTLTLLAKNNIGENVAFDDNNTTYNYANASIKDEVDSYVSTLATNWGHSINYGRLLQQDDFERLIVDLTINEHDVGKDSYWVEVTWDENEVHASIIGRTRILDRLASN